MSQIFGNFVESFPPEQDSLELTFTPNSLPIKKRWRSNRLSAHFIADYFSNFLPVDEEDPTHERRIKESKGAVSYVANELLENAMKFNNPTSKFKIKFGIHFIEEFEVTAVIFATNSVNAEGLEKFQRFIQELLSSDPEELYVQQIEKSTEEENSEASGLGFLTMINDYSAKLGWKFEIVQEDPKILTVTTMALVPI
ncbi:hypothetical protein Cri9333_1839 [Crinalium epipsammum PCC 9333]|uniref:ATP-binding region ATPase domain protein n=1 Tax=Crinalium epipsammum PCC 9333 TaxID=1173022 RepID=K9VX83_9CYAN|nr:DUF6272 family protein [Crinalium epipsammum]AFZ12723.1 hypothetical protein Cri9333_1839 [Crinalium epipsammum PCC 9333]